MKYIIFRKNTNKVERIFSKEPISYTDKLAVARCETIPQGKKFTAINIQEQQEEYIERVNETVTLATGIEKEIVRAVKKTRYFKTCDLIAEN